MDSLGNWEHIQQAVYGEVIESKVMMTAAFEKPENQPGKFQYHFALRDKSSENEEQDSKQGGEEREEEEEEMSTGVLDWQLMNRSSIALPAAGTYVLKASFLPSLESRAHQKLWERSGRINILN